MFGAADTIFVDEPSVFLGFFPKFPLEKNLIFGHFFLIIPRVQIGTNKVLLERVHAPALTR